MNNYYRYSFVNTIHVFFQCISIRIIIIMPYDKNFKMTVFKSMICEYFNFNDKTLVWNTVRIANNYYFKILLLIDHQ